MIPVLYSETEKDFGHNGIGVLTYTLDYEVTEEANGELELYLEYPADSQWASELKDQRLIKAKPNDMDAPHVFRIYEIIKNLNEQTIYVYATTRTNDLAGNLVLDVTVSSKTAQEAMNLIKNNLVEPTDFNLISDIQTRSSTRWTRRNPLNCIVGEDDSLVKYWGGEVKRTNDTIYLYSRRGRDNVTVLRQGKNLEGFEMTVSTKGLITRILPYFSYVAEDSETTTTIVGSIVDSPLVNNYPIRSIMPVDYSDDESVTDLASLNKAAKRYFSYRNPDSDKPTVTTTVDLLQLSDSAEYAKFKGLETIGVFDTVTVWVEKYNVDVTVKINKVVYNGLKEQVVRVYAGNPKGGLYSDIRKQYAQGISELRKYVDGVENGIRNVIQMSADGKAKIFRGYTEPPIEIVNVNDLWYKEIGNGEVEVYIFNGLSWDALITAGLNEATRLAVENALAEAEQAKTDAEQAYTDSVAEAGKLVAAQTEAFDAEMALRQGEIQDAKNQADIAVGKANSNAEAIFGKLDLATYEANKTAVETELGKKLATATYTAQKQTQDALIAGKVAIDTYNTKVTELNSLIAAAQSKADTAAADLLKKADTTTVNAELAKKLATSTYNTKMASLDTAISGHNTRIKATEDGLVLTATKVEVDAVRTRMSEAETEISQNSDAIALKASQSSLDTTNGKLATAEATLVVQAGQIASKVAQTDFNALNGRVSTAETTITQQAGQIALKASQLDLDAATGDISDVQSSLKLQAGEIALKASKTSVDTLTGRVGTAETNISANTTAINLRATKSSVDTLTGRVTTAEGTITAQAGQIALKAATTTVNALTGRVSAAEASLSVQSGKIALAATKTELTTAIDGIQVGGRNLAKGTSSEFAYVRVGPYSGNLAGVATSQFTYTLEELGVQVGDVMTVGMYVGESVEGYGGGCRIDDQNGSNKYSTYKVVKNGYVSETFIILEGTTMIRLYTAGVGPSGASASFDLPVKELKLEKGNKATDWTPAPEDVDSAISTVQANLTVEAGKIASKVSQTDFNALSGRMSTAETTIVSNTTAINLRATKSSVDTLTGRVTTAEGTISTQAGQIALRATTATVNALTGRVSTAEASIVAQSGRIDLAATKSELTSAIEGIQVGGRNYFTKSHNFAIMKAVRTLTSRGPEYPNGLYVVGEPTNDSKVRIRNAITGNGWWTVSFDYWGTQSLPISMGVSINDYSSITVHTNGKRDNGRVRVYASFNITNYSDIYNFVDFTDIRYVYNYIDNIKIEKGNKATDWSPAPEDVDSAISTVQANLTVEAGKITALTTRVSGAESNITSVTQTVSGINTTISTLRTDVNGKATIVALNQVKSTADGNKTTLTNHAGRLTTAETNISGIQTTVATKADKSQITQLENSITSIVSKGTNTLHNGDFSEGLKGWIANASGVQVSTLVNGEVVLNLPPAAAGVFQAASDLNIASDYYTFTFRAKTDPGLSASAYIGFLNLNSYYNNSFVLKDTWETYSFTTKFVVTGNTNFHIYSRTGNTGNIYIDWITLQRGSYASESQITQLSDQINLRVTGGDVTAAILADKKIKDTRTTNQLPSWYFTNYPSQRVEEFKQRATMGVPGASTYVKLVTDVPWSGSSGGVVVQTAYSSDGVYNRSGNSAGTAWGAWVKQTDSANVLAQVNLSTEGVLIQGKRIQLDGDVTMTSAFTTRLDTQTLTAITANITSIRSKVLVANSVTSTHIKAENAMIDKLFATEALIGRLTSKAAFIADIQAVNISATKITSGTLNASNVNIINMNASNIVTGTLSAIKVVNTFNRGGGVTGTITIDSDINMQATDGSRFLLSEKRISFSNGDYETVVRNDGIDFYRAGVKHMGQRFFTFEDGTSGIRFESRHVGERALSIRGNQLLAHDGAGGREGEHHLYLSPGGTGYVVAGDATGARSVMRARTFELNRGVGLTTYDTGDAKMRLYSQGFIWHWGTSATVTNQMLRMDSDAFRMYKDLDMTGRVVKNTSDRRFKSGIRATSVKGRDIIRKLNFVDFFYTKENYPTDLQFGLIGQDSPFIGVQGEDGYWSINTTRQTMLNSLVAQEHDRELTRVSTFVNQHEIEIQLLKDRIKQLEEKIA